MLLRTLSKILKKEEKKSLKTRKSELKKKE